MYQSGIWLSTRFYRVINTINQNICKSFSDNGLRLFAPPVLIDMMLTTNKELVDKLAEGIATINEVMADLRGESPFAVAVNTREQVMAILAQGLCLNGAHEIPQGMAIVRGMCRECYNAAKAAGFTEHTLVTLGLQTAEKSKGGRRRKLRESPLRQLIEGRPLGSAADPDSRATIDGMPLPKSPPASQQQSPTSEKPKK